MLIINTSNGCVCFKSEEVAHIPWMRERDGRIIKLNYTVDVIRRLVAFSQGDSTKSKYYLLLGTQDMLDVLKMSVEITYPEPMEYVNSVLKILAYSEAIPKTIVLTIAAIILRKDIVIGTIVIAVSIIVKKFFKL